MTRTELQWQRMIAGSYEARLDGYEDEALARWEIYRRGSRWFVVEPGERHASSIHSSLREAKAEAEAIQAIWDGR